MKSYPQNKDSGLKWIGRTSKHWDIIKTKYLFKLSTKKAPENNDYELLSLYTNIGVRPRKDLEERGNKASTTDGYFLVEKGDIIVNKLLAWMGAIGCSDYEGVTSPAYDILKQVRPLNSKFYHYLFRSGLYLTEFRRRSRGIMDMRLRLYFDEFGQIPLLKPPLEEQDKIADFLDHKTHLIDSLIEKKQKQIELYKEQRAAIINEAVTKGLDPNVELKDSGIEWLGEVPYRWSVKPLKYIASAIIGLTYSPSELTDETKGILVLRASNIKNGQLVFDDVVYVTKKVPDQLITQEGDILVCSRSGSRNLIGKNAIINKDAAGNTFGAFMTIIRSEYNRFLYYVFNSVLFDYQAGTFLTSTINQLTQSNLNSFRIPLPPINEQNEIIAYLNKQTKKIDTHIQNKHQQIKLLKEFRVTLISDVVTGKIDIREEIIP